MGALNFIPHPIYFWDTKFFIFILFFIFLTFACVDIIPILASPITSTQVYSCCTLHGIRRHDFPVIVVSVEIEQTDTLRVEVCH